MLNSEKENNTQTFFSKVSTEKLQNFILSPNGKDKKGLDHICYGDQKGGGHMKLNKRNLERKREELSKKHYEKASSDCEKLKEKLKANYERRLNKLDQERKAEDCTENKKIEDNFKLALQKAEEKRKKKVKDAVENEINQLEKRINKIINEEKTTHNFFPLEWGPLEIEEIISDIIKDKNSTITEVLTPTSATTGEKEVVSTGARDKRALGQSWEVKGEYKGRYKGEYSEIAITVIIAEDNESESKKMKLISGYPTNKIEKQQHLSPTFSR